MRAESTIAAFDAEHLSHLSGVNRQAGTRYASIVAFGGAGVTGRADYSTLATAIRLRLMQAPYNLRPNGEGVAATNWLSATGIHANGADKGRDSLPLKFSDRREIALCADGRFRLQAPNAAGVRFIRTDSEALKAFEAGKPAAAPLAPASTTPAPTETPASTTPRVPTAPTVAANASGALTATARCLHCSAKNFVTDAACRACKREDWKLA